MKKLSFVILIALLGYAAVAANPVENAQGVVSFSENITVYFNNEANATHWLESQRDFMSHREWTAGERRVMSNMMESLIPGWSDMVRMHSDFTVMVVRSSTPGESSLSLYVRGVLTRFWQY